MVYIANNLEEFQELYTNIISKNYQLNGEYIEGFVIEDSNQFMVKIKTNYYDTWKSIRSKMEMALKNHNFQFPKYRDELEKSFMEYLYKKYENINFDRKKLNIIVERNEFKNN